MAEDVKMTKFCFSANVVFEAVDLDDAFAKLAEHFRRLSKSGDEDAPDDMNGYIDQFVVGPSKLDIRPVEDDD